MPPTTWYGDRVAAELLFEHARLGVGAIEDGDVGGTDRVPGVGARAFACAHEVGGVAGRPSHRAALEQLLDLAGDELRLGALVVDLDDLHGRAGAARRPEVLALALALLATTALATSRIASVER